MMKIICTKCGIEASSKCPALRSIFPSREGEKESNFWQGMGFYLKPAGEGWKEGVKRLHVTMLVFPGETEEVAMARFVKKMKSMPDDPQYLCKHEYVHTEDCFICSFRLEVADV